ncbi:MAG: hypothetical protein WDA42_00895 [Candidatus Bathyarchaeia archaeon]
MPKFSVGRREVYVEWFEVEADSADEAVDIVNGLDDEDPRILHRGPQCYDETLGPNEWYTHPLD